MMRNRIANFRGAFRTSQGRGMFIFAAPMILTTYF
jgi:hypothetical protein